jgi:preprotein translocase subunit Sec61beta
MSTKSFQRQMSFADAGIADDGELEFGQYSPRVMWMAAVAVMLLVAAVTLLAAR